MEFYRTIEQDLNNWKVSSHRKPLIIRGARQVGKTTLIKKFGKQYKKFISLNLEKPKYQEWFKTGYEVKKLMEIIGLEFGVKVEEYKDCLLFIDEIQEVPEAIGLLRYFYEEIPELHVISAGSLLERALKNIRSYPVGRVEYKYLHPLSFSEFLLAIGKDTLEKTLHTIPNEPHTHKLLLEYFHIYAIIGGMPEVVAVYKENMVINNLPPIYASIRETYKDDVQKYTKNATAEKIMKHIMNEAPLLVDQRVKFQNFGNSQYRTEEVKEAFSKLSMAKVIRVIRPTTSIKAPILPNIRKSPRLQFLDTGILNYALHIQQNLLQIEELSTAYKGAIIPHLITQEIIAKGNTIENIPNFRVREKSQSTAEVDIVRTYKDKIIPIEIKSGATGTLRSLHSFMDKVDHPYAIRIYAGEFSIQQAKTREGKEFLLMNMPYYLGGKLDEYIKYFIENHK